MEEIIVVPGRSCKRPFRRSGTAQRYQEHGSYRNLLADPTLFMHIYHLFGRGVKRVCVCVRMACILDRLLESSDDEAQGKPEQKTRSALSDEARRPNAGLIHAEISSAVMAAVSDDALECRLRSSDDLLSTNDNQMAHASSAVFGKLRTAASLQATQKGGS